MNKSIAILFLEFRELVSKQIIDLSSTLMRHDFEIRNQKDQLSKTKDIIIYCNTGRRSRPVVHMLKKLHNISTYNLAGGYKNFLKTSAK